MKQKIKSIYGFVMFSGMLFFGASFLFMMLWNGSVAQVTELPTLNYWLAVRCLVSIFATVGIIWLAVQTAKFAVLSISLAITKRRLTKLANEVKQNQDELIKHFTMFNQQEEKE